MIRRLVPLLALACVPGTTDRVPGDTDATDTAPAADTSILGGDGDTDDDTPSTPNERQRNLRSGSGDYALEYLRDDPWTKIVVEIDFVQGHRPSQGALDEIEDVLDALCRKPDGIEVIVDDAIPDPSNEAWSVAAGEEVELAWRDRYHDPDTGTAVLYILYLDEGSVRDGNGGFILGYAYHGSSIVMFPENIERLEPGLLSFLADPESTVMAHELGHVLGLVNNGAAMQTDHEDPDHRHHDDDTSCLMYWRVENEGLGDVLLQRRPEFDDACLDDVEAAGGRTRREARNRLDR